MTFLISAFCPSSNPINSDHPGSLQGHEERVDIKASCKLKNPRHGWELLLLLILHSQQGQRKPEAAWEVGCLPFFLGMGWKKGAAGRTQIRSYLHSSSLSCPERCWLSQAQGQPASCSSGGWRQGHRGERVALQPCQSRQRRSHASQGTMPQLSLPDSLPRTPTPPPAHLIQSP